MISLSPSVRALLDLLQFRCSVAIDIVDATLRAVPPLSSADFVGVIEEPGVRERCLAVLRSGETLIDLGPPVPLALYPVRRDGQIVGLLVITRRGGKPAAFLDDDEHRQLEAVSQIARGVVENGLTVGDQLTQAADRTRRLQGILRFISQLSARDGESDMMQAVVQAATVWFDLDCRIYYREPDGDFSLFAALPGVDRSDANSRLDGSRIRDLAAVRRLFSFSDVEVLDWPARRGEVLVVSVGEGPEWVMLLNGAIEPEVELTFTAIAHVIRGELEQEAHRRTEHWQQRLAVHTIQADLPPERALVLLLEELAAAAGAAGAHATLERSGARQRVSTGDGTHERVPPPVEGEPDRGRHLRVIPIGFEAQVRLELWGRKEPFEFDSLAAVDAWVAAVRPWLSGTTLGAARGDIIDNRTEELAFERRVQDEVERAKRFNLGLSLVLIDSREIASGEVSSATALAEAVRRELRASDLLGHVRGGVLAVLLVHAGPEGAQSVAKRLRLRAAMALAHTHQAVVRLGQAVFSSDCHSGEALIGQALRGLELNGRS